MCKSSHVDTFDSSWRVWKMLSAKCQDSGIMLAKPMHYANRLRMNAHSGANVMNVYGGVIQRSTHGDQLVM